MEPKALDPPLLPELFGSHPSGVVRSVQQDAVDAMDAMDDSLPGLHHYKGTLYCFLGFFCRQISKQRHQVIAPSRTMWRTMQKVEVYFFKVLEEM